jgi:predicted metal-binding protein
MILVQDDERSGFASRQSTYSLDRHLLTVEMGASNSKTLFRDFLKMACELGATGARIFDAQDIVVDERVRLKCCVPVCRNYNVSLMCPPNVMPVDEFRVVLARFKKALLVQIAYNVPDWMLDRIHAAQDLAALYKDERYLNGWEQTYLVAKNTLNTIADRIEAAAFKAGLKFATAFSAGKCTLCEECAGTGNRCRNPYKARPSMEAMGIDVGETARKAGLPFEEAASDRIVLNALILLC